MSSFYSLPEDPPVDYSFLQRTPDAPCMQLSISTRDENRKRATISEYDVAVDKSHKYTARA
jgi:hypothetical protein